MKYEVNKGLHTLSNGKEIEVINLKLGLNHEVSFPSDATVEEIVGGVESLIKLVVGVSAFELVEAVLKKAVSKDG